MRQKTNELPPAGTTTTNKGYLFDWLTDVADWIKILALSVRVYRSHVYRCGLLSVVYTFTQKQNARTEAGGRAVAVAAGEGYSAVNRWLPLY